MSATVKPNVRYKTITPEEAYVILRRSKRKNVPVKKRKIDEYARVMWHSHHNPEGNIKWDEFNSQAVSIDTNEDIVNGHQRLMACRQAGVPFRTLFITGVPPESFKTEDTGRTRDAGHFFAIAGEKNYVALASGSRAALAFDRGQWRLAATTSGGGNISVPYEELAAEVERRPDLRQAAAYYDAKCQIALRGRLKAGAMICLYAMGIGHKAHAEFWKELVERLSVDKKSPAYQLNRRIDYVKARGGNLSAIHQLALLTKAWNQYSSDDWKNVLVWDPNGEKFPQPLTDWKPELVVPEDQELITVTPPTVKRPRPADGPPKLKVVPKPEKRKKGPKLRGGLGASAG